MTKCIQTRSILSRFLFPHIGFFMKFDHQPKKIYLPTAAAVATWLAAHFARLRQIDMAFFLFYH